jgi:hypothetical protein
MAKHPAITRPCLSQISLQYRAITTASGHCARVPRYCRDTARVAPKRTDEAASLSVPNLSDAEVRADGEMVTPLGPAD